MQNMYWIKNEVTADAERKGKNFTPPWEKRMILVRASFYAVPPADILPES